MTSETKKPAAGEWWEFRADSNNEYGIGYCVGVDDTGEVVWKDEDGDIGTEGMGFAAKSPIRHLPDCDGFSYTPPRKPPEGCVAFQGAGWYRTVGGKCVELSENLDSDRSSGFHSVDCPGRRDGDWTWSTDGTIGGVGPEDGEPIEDWYLAEKLDKNPPELVGGFEHLHPPELRVPKPGEQYRSFFGKRCKCAVGEETNMDIGEGRRWIVRKVKPATKTITLSRWLIRTENGFRLSDWRDTVPGIIDVVSKKPFESRTIEVPSE